MKREREQEREDDWCVQVLPAEMPALCLIARTYQLVVQQVVPPSVEQAEVSEQVSQWAEQCQALQRHIQQEQGPKDALVTTHWTTKQVMVCVTAMTYYAHLLEAGLAPASPPLSAKEILRLARQFQARVLNQA